MTEASQHRIVIGPTLTDEQVQAGRDAVKLLCSFFGEGMYDEISELRLKVGDLLEATLGGTDEVVQARFVCR